MSEPEHNSINTVSYSIDSDMPEKGYRVITVSERTYKLLQTLREIREKETGHRVSLNDLLTEILQAYSVQTQVIEQ